MKRGASFEAPFFIRESVQDENLQVSVAGSTPKYDNKNPIGFLSQRRLSTVAFSI